MGNESPRPRSDDGAAEPEAAGEQPTLAEQITRVYDQLVGFHATHLLEIARELGIWHAITAKPGITSAALAQELGTDDFYTDTLCRTAFSIGFLEREADGWRMAPHLDAILGQPDSPFYLAAAPGLHLRMAGDYADFPRHFREGTRTGYQEHGDDFMAEVALGTKGMPGIFIDAVLPQLPELQARFEAGGRVLDLGCGAGWAIVKLAERFPGVSCVGVDIEPHSVELAKQLIAERGLSDRCEARVHAPDGPNAAAEYDVVTSFLVIHEIDPAEKDAVFAGVAEALVPGGLFLIYDEAYPDSDAALRTMPSRFAAWAQWYEMTWGNIVDTAAELRARCERAGLEVVRETGFSRFHIVLARRP